MGAPVGNQNAAKAKMWSAAIHRALEKRGGGDKLRALDDLAEKLLAACDKADLSALKEFGDRMDGKPAQAVSLSGPDDGPMELNVNTVEFVRAAIPGP